MNTDIVIVGAGPAGIFTAIEMIRKGSKKRIKAARQNQRRTGQNEQLTRRFSQKFRKNKGTHTIFVGCACFFYSTNQ